MANPYEPPKADIGSGITVKRSVWWKVYFFIITILSFLGGIAFLMEEGAGIVEYAQLALLVIATAGLFGFAFEKRILFPKFWIPFLVFNIVMGLAYEAMSSVDLRAGMTDMEFYIGMAIGYLISLPGYYALYKYGKENESPWAKA